MIAERKLKTRSSKINLKAFAETKFAIDQPVIVPGSGFIFLAARFLSCPITLSRILINGFSIARFSNQATITLAVVQASFNYAGKQLGRDQKATENKKQVNTCPAKLQKAFCPTRMREYQLIMETQNKQNGQRPQMIESVMFMRCFQISFLPVFVHLYKSD